MAESCACERSQLPVQSECKACLLAARAARRCSTEWRPQGAAGQFLCVAVNACSNVLCRQAHHSAHLSRPCRRCHDPQSRCCVLPKRPGKSRRAAGSALRTRFDLRGITCASFSQPRQGFLFSRCGRISLLFRLRSEAAPRKVFPADYRRRRAPLVMTTHHQAARKCADPATFSSISRSRLPNGDHCGFRVFAFLSCSQSGLQHATC